MREVGFEVARSVWRIRRLGYKACRFMRVVDAVALVVTVARLAGGAGGWWWVALVWFPIALVGDWIGVRKLRPPPRRRRRRARRPTESAVAGSSGRRRRQARPRRPRRPVP